MPAKIPTSERGPESLGCPGSTKPAARYDRELHARLHADHHTAVVWFLRRRGVPHDLAQDLAGKAVLTVAHMPDRLDPDRSPRSLLFTIANHARVSRWRRDGRSRPLGPTDRNSLTDRRPEPHLEVARAEFGEQFRAALATLPTLLRRVLKRYERGEDRPTAARRLGVSLKRLDALRAKAVRALVAANPSLAARW